MSPHKILYEKVLLLIQDYENRKRATDQTIKHLVKQKTKINNALQLLASIKSKLEKNI